MGALLGRGVVGSSPEGACKGTLDGDPDDGSGVGLVVLGACDGALLGESCGASVGDDGSGVGLVVLGACDGALLGESCGASVGTFMGARLGVPVGSEVGLTAGAPVDCTVVSPC